MRIEDEILDWDGKSASDIDEIYNRYNNEGSFASNLIELARRPGLQIGATWLIKRHLNGNH